MEQATYDRKRADLRHDPKTRTCLLVRFLAALIFVILTAVPFLLNPLSRLLDGVDPDFLAAYRTYVLPGAWVVCTLITAGCLFAVRSLSRSYRTAAWLNVGAAVVQILASVLGALLSQPSKLAIDSVRFEQNMNVLGIACAIAFFVLSLIGLLLEMRAHSESMVELGPELTNDWETLGSRIKLFFGLTFVYIPVVGFVGIGLFALASMLHLIDLIPILLFLSLLVPYVGFALYFIVRYFVLLKRTRNVYTATMKDAVRVETAYAEELQKRIEANPLLRNSAK